MLFYFILCMFWVFIDVHRLSLVVLREGYSSLQRSGFSSQGLSCCIARALGSWASLVVAHGV